MLPRARMEYRPSTLRTIRIREPLAVIAQWSEICAYGTAVTVEPVSDAAKVQHAEFGRTGFEHQEAYSTNVSEWRPNVTGPG